MITKIWKMCQLTALLHPFICIFYRGKVGQSMITPSIFSLSMPVQLALISNSFPLSEGTGEIPLKLSSLRVIEQGSFPCFMQNRKAKLKILSLLLVVTLDENSFRLQSRTCNVKPAERYSFHYAVILTIKTSQ